MLTLLITEDYENRLSPFEKLWMRGELKKKLHVVDGGAELTGMDQIKRNMARFDRRQKKLSIERKLENSNVGII
jgi:uncharacterized protein YqgV (UPF0045/DUF77 family)